MDEQCMDASSKSLPQTKIMSDDTGGGDEILPVEGLGGTGLGSKPSSVMSSRSTTGDGSDITGAGVEGLGGTGLGTKPSSVMSSRSTTGDGSDITGAGVEGLGGTGLGTKGDTQRDWQSFEH